MTPRRVTAPGPRTVTPHQAASSASKLVLGALVAMAALIAACGPTTVAPSAPASTSAPGPSAPSGSIGTAGSPSPGVAGPGSSIPRWPGSTVLAVIALGAADGEFQKAGADLAAAAESKDLRAMWGAADGLAKLADGLMTNVERLEAYEGTKSIAAVYRSALPEMSAGAKELRDAITAGDASGVTSGYLRILEGTKRYAPIRREIGGLVEQALVQQRLLVR
jgi:hypothetical protein